MDRKSFVPQQLGPQTFPEIPDATEGMGTSSLEDESIDVSQQASEDLFRSYNDKVPSDVIREVVKQQRVIPKDGVVVHRSPSLTASGDEMNNNIYSKIVSKLNRLAVDIGGEGTEKEVLPEEPYAGTGAPGVGKNPKQLAQEEARRKEEEARAAVEEYKQKVKTDRERAQAEADAAAAARKEKYGNPAEEAFVSDTDYRRYKKRNIGPDSKGYEKSSLAVRKLLEIMVKSADIMDSWVTSAEVVYREGRLLKKALAGAKKVVSEQIDASSATVTPVAAKVDNLLSQFGLSSVQIETDSGTAKRVRSLTAQSGDMQLEDLASIYSDPSRLESQIQRLKSNTGGRAKDSEKHIAFLESLESGDFRDLDDAMKFVYGAIKGAADKMNKSKAKFSGLVVKWGPEAEAVLIRLQTVKQRAIEYRQSLPSMVEKNRMTELEMKEEKERIGKYMGTLDAAMKVADGFMKRRISEGDLKAYLGFLMERRAAAGVLEAKTDIEGIDSLMGSAIEDAFGWISPDMLDELSEVYNLAAESDSQMSSALDILEPAMELAKSSLSPTDEVMDVSGHEYGEEEDELFGGVMQPQPQTAPPAFAIASDRSPIIRESRKDTGGKGSKLPFESGGPFGNKLSDADLAKQPLSQEEYNKALLKKEKADEKAKKEKAKREEKSKDPENVKKQDIKDTAEAVRQFVNNAISESDKRNFIADRNINSEMLKQFKQAQSDAKRSIGMAIVAAEGESSGAAARPDVSGLRIKNDIDGYSVVDASGKLFDGPFDSHQKAQDAIDANAVARHKSFRESQAAEMANLLDEMHDAMEDFASALELDDPSIDKYSEAVINIGDLFQLVSRPEFEYIVEDKKLFANLERHDIAVALTLARKKAKQAGDVDMVKKLKKLSSMFRAVADYTESYSNRSSGSYSPAARDYVRQELGAPLETAKKIIETGKGWVAEPISTEKLDNPEASVYGAIIRTAEDSDNFVSDGKKLVSEMKASLADAMEVANVIKATNSLYDNCRALIADAIAAFSGPASDTGAEQSEESGDKAYSPYEDISSLMRDWGGRAMDAAVGIGNELTMGLSPRAPATLLASDLVKMTRKAGEFDKFDASQNRLEIVEGEGGKRKLVINKGLKNLVSKKVREMMSGGFKCGDTVQVDFVDYVGFGTVKAYLGSGVYRVEVDGAIMEVPSKSVYGIGESPF